MFWYQDGAIFYVNKETLAWRLNALWMFRLAKRTKEIFHNSYCTMLFQISKRYIFGSISAKKTRNNYTKTIILKLTVMSITDWNIMYRVNRLNVVSGKTLICCNTATVISFTMK